MHRSDAADIDAGLLELALRRKPEDIIAHNRNKRNLCAVVFRQMLGYLERTPAVLHTDIGLVVFNHRIVPAELIAGEPYLIPVALAGLRAHGALVILAEAFQLLSAGGHLCPGSRIDPGLPQRLLILFLL